MAILVGKNAPDFQAKAVLKNTIIENFTLSQFRGKYVVLFFYPLDFTFVCPTELHAFNDALQDIKSRNAELIGCSVDSCYAHQAWLDMPRSKGGIEGLEYPLISDINKTITSDYGVLHPDGIAYRGLFLIDRQGVVRHQLVNDLPLGRSVSEAVRMLDALQAFENQGEVCPANWHKGEKGMVPTHEGLEKYIAATLPTSKKAALV
ncbi:MAG: peroxiredoxin [Parachlamydiales bacterium]|jgi:peroxiredoxin (alkyl hydroperoxide reductase subunit C)